MFMLEYSMKTVAVPTHSFRGFVIRLPYCQFKLNKPRAAIFRPPCDCNVLISQRFELDQWDGF